MRSGRRDREGARSFRAVAGVVALDEETADRAATLFNATGRRRGLRTDSLIAATAIQADAELATFNTADYRLFVSFGLKLLAL